MNVKAKEILLCATEGKTDEKSARRSSSYLMEIYEPPYKAKVLYTTLSPEVEKRLQETLAEEE